MKLSTYHKQFRVAYIQNIRKYKSWSAEMAFLTLTYRCQCKCVHCGIALYKQKKEKELTYNEIISLIDEIKKLRVSWIYFFGGEPLIVPELPRYIKYAKQKGLKVRLDTNGLLLDENMVKKLKEVGVDTICVSIDSPFEATHDKLRGVDGIFKRAMAGFKYCKKHNLECHLSTYATKKNLKNGELKKTINLAKNLNIPTRILSPVCVGNWLKRKDLLLSGKDILLLRSLLKKNKVYWENGYIDSEEVEFFCLAMNRFIFYISPYGDVQPCSFFPISFGNIRNEPLEYIVNKMWSSAVFKDYIDREFYDCPFNNKSFRQRYKMLTESRTTFPIEYNYTYGVNNIKEKMSQITS